MTLTVAGPVGCKQGRKEGRRERKVRFTDGSMAELGGASILGLDGKVYPYRLRDPIALARPRRYFFDGSEHNVVPASVRLALRVLNRRADQQRLVDGIAQLNSGCGRAAQMSHRDGNDIGGGSA